MADYTEKEQKVVSNIADTIEKLDDSIAKLDTLESDSKSHSISHIQLKNGTTSTKLFTKSSTS